MNRIRVLKIFYASLVLLLNAIHLESKIGMDYFSLEERKNLEKCFIQSNEKSGSLFANMTTRHHRKVFIDKSAQPNNNKTSFTEEVDSSIERRRKSSSTTAPNDPFESTTMYYDVVKTLKSDKKTLHTRRNTVQDDEKALDTKLKRSFKATRINRIMNLRSKEKGIFLTGNCTTVVAQIGTTAVLHCEVSDITENTDWALHIRFATSLDAGYYECQVPTHPPTSIFYKLVLLAAVAEILGEPEKLIHEGSMLRLICVVRNSTEPPTYVFWYFEDRMINYDQNGISVINGGHSSELIIASAQLRHAGNYTCLPANSRAHSVIVHVVQSETPAAMQHGNSSSSYSIHISSQIFTLCILLSAINILNR